MALVPDQKFSTFQDGGDLEVGDIIVGLRGGLNTRFDYTGEVPPGVVVPIANGGTGATTAAGARTNLGLGTMAVQNANAVAITGGTLAGVTITASTAALTAGSVVAAPVAGIDIANKTYVDSSIGGLGAALTRTNDTNVTLTLGGTPATALLQATSITAGWSGQLSLARGGTNANLTASNGGIVYSNATQMAILAGTATARQMLQSGATAAPAWSTTTWPATSTINRILYSSAANVIGEIASPNSGMIVTNSSGVPSGTSSMTNGQVVIGSTGGTPAPATLTADGATVITNAANSITISTPNNTSKNMIIGGNFGTNPWQRGTTFAAPSSGAYTADRWQQAFTGTMIATITKSSNAPTVAQAGILTTSSLLVTVTTAQASIGAADRYYVAQRMEGYNFSQIAQRPFIVSFWVKATVTGVYCVGLVNGGADRSFIGEYTINTTNTWEYKTIAVSASPSAGTWDYTNGIGLYCIFNLATGSNFQTTANSWQTGNFTASSSQVNSVASINNTFQLALVQVEPGSVATPFEIKTEQEVLTACQRYCIKSFPQGFTPASGVVSSGSAAYRVQSASTTIAWSYTINLPVNMRTTPMVTYYSTNTMGSSAWYNQTLAADSGSPASLAASENRLVIINPQVVGDLVGQTIIVQYLLTAEL